MEILSFDIAGKFAHFRKFHGNNTALSYSIPPRTTIIGILAAIVGQEKGTYHENFRSDHLQVGISVQGEIKKTFHRLNFLKIISRDDFSGKSGPVQTPFEVVTRDKVRASSVTYRIYLSAGDTTVPYEKIKSHLISGEYVYSLSLGTANFTASISNFQVYERAKMITAAEEWVTLHSACNSEQVSEISFDEYASYRFNHVEEELMPADFVTDHDREVYRMNRVLFATTDFPINVKLNGSYYEIIGGRGNIRNIQFLVYAGLLS